MKRVLIVDDAAFMRMSIKNIVANYEFEIVGEVENGLMAIEKYQELQPDIVTMDITMPEMDALQALEKLKKLIQVTSVVMVSALGQKQNERGNYLRSKRVYRQNLLKKRLLYLLYLNCNLF